MNAAMAAAQRKARLLASLADSTTFDGERENARDAYFRVCDNHGLDPRTLEPLNRPADGRRNGTDAFFDAQAADPTLRYEDWLEEQTDQRLSRFRDVFARSRRVA